MKVTIFSSNQPRHLNLVKEFSQIADEVFFVNEVNTVFPGQVTDFFQKSDVMKAYFSHVITSEKYIFGDIRFLPKNVRTLAIKSGDLNQLNNIQLRDAISSDLYIVFGASYIKGWLVDFLVENRAINIHMGLSPYYRGSSCNFWAMYDNNPGYVGATIHLLSKGLDSGNMLFHCVPKPIRGDTPYDFTMRAVLVAQTGLLEKVRKNEIFSMESVTQDKSQQIRYTKNNEFTDAVAQDFMSRAIKMEDTNFVYPNLLNPYFG